MIRPAAEATLPPSTTLCRSRGAGARGPVAQLTMAIVAPAVRRAAGRYAARVERSGSHRGEPEPARDRHWGRVPRGGPVAELAKEVVAPAIRRAARGYPTGMPDPGTERREAQPARDRGRTRAVPWGRRGPVAEMAE